MEKVIIYGATSAIAVEYAKLTLGSDHRLFLVGRDQSRVDAVVKDLSVRYDLKDGQLLSSVVDFQDNEALQKSFSLAVDELGGATKVLVAHGSLPVQEELELSIKQVEYHNQVNFLSVVALCEVAGKYFSGGSSNQISVISSVAGDRGRKSNYFYGSSKGALSLYLQGLRNRLESEGVSVLTVKPGFVDTPMTVSIEKGLLWAKPDQIAQGIFRAEQKGKEVVYLPFFWWGIMLVIKLIPETVFKKMSI